MKRFVFFVACMTMLVSCSQQPSEKKARKLIESDVKELLVDPESYELVRLQIDSVFEGNLASIKIGIDLARLYDNYKVAVEGVEEAEAQMSIFAPSYGYQSSYSRMQYKKYKAEKERADKKAKKAVEALINYYGDNEETFALANQGGGEFEGWGVSIIFKAKNAYGVESMNERLYFLDSKMTKIIENYGEEELGMLRSFNAEDMAEELGEEINEALEKKRN